MLRMTSGWIPAFAGMTFFYYGFNSIVAVDPTGFNPEKKVLW